jgi:hypothetical protein
VLGRPDLTDFREISQGYAQGAIRAVILINSGAAVALLSQLSLLVPEVGARAIGIAFICFVFCVLCLVWRLASHLGLVVFTMLDLST